MLLSKRKEKGGLRESSGIEKECESHRCEHDKERSLILGEEKWSQHVVLHKNCTIYTMSYNPTTHATCWLVFMAYKYSELQMSSTTQKLNCKASCKTPIFIIEIYSFFNNL